MLIHTYCSINTCIHKYLCEYMGFVLCVGLNIRDRERETDRQTDRQTETDRDRQRQRQTETETDGERDWSQVID